MTPATVPVRFVVPLVAAGAFGVAIVPGFGAYDLRAVVCVVAGLALLGSAFFAALRTRPGRVVPARAALLALWVLVAGMAWIALRDPAPLLYAFTGWPAGRWVQLLLLLMLLSYLPALLIPRLVEGHFVRHLRFSLVAAAMAAGGWSVILAAPRPYIDVWDMQQAGAGVLMGGANPYEHVAVHNTAPGVDEPLPYLYPPLQILFTLPSYLLAGDVRYTMLVALLAAGMALRIITRAAGRELPAFGEDAPALFVWLTPKFWFLLEQAWVDPVQLALLCLAVAAYVRGRRRSAAVLFGLALASKQISFWLAGLAAFCLRLTLRQWLIAALAAAATVLPFLLAGPGALYDSAVSYVGRLPARPDALTLPNWALRDLGTPAWPGLAFPLAAAVVALAAWRLRRSVAGFCLAAALTYALFFAFNKFAFANYWFLVAGLSALAAAAALHPHETAASVTSPPREPLREGAA